jgi:hypothetical protein
MGRRFFSTFLVMLVVAAIFPLQADAAPCAPTLLMVSPTGCTSIECDLAYSITELRTGRTTCYYDNCGVVYIENCR